MSYFVQGYIAFGYFESTVVTSTENVAPPIDYVLVKTPYMRPGDYLYGPAPTERPAFRIPRGATIPRWWRK